MNYIIPLSKIGKLESIVNRAIKKGGAIVFEKGEETVRDGALRIQDPKTGVETVWPIKIRCVEVEVEGSYKIDGWEFVGTVQWTPNGNIIRLANSEFEGKVPERYNRTEMICEHCGTKRARKDTYLIRNSETGEFKQVGRGCLGEFTHGLNAEECAEIMSTLSRCEELQDGDFAESEFFGRDSIGAGTDASVVKAYAVALIKKFGYQGSAAGYPTREKLGNILFPAHLDKDDPLREVEPDYSSIPEIDEFAKSITDTYGYMYNAKLAWLNDYAEYRDFGLIASFAYVYLRDKEREEIRKKELESRKSEYAGEVGQRIELEVASVKTISYSYQFETYYYAIVGTDGLTYLWSTCAVVSGGERIKATIKSLSEYKGLKQTTITRGRIQ